MAGRALEEKHQAACTGGKHPNEHDCLRLGEASPHQAMRQVVVVADVEWLPNSPAEEDDPHQVHERHSEYKQGTEDGPGMWMICRVEVRQNREHGEKEADEVASSVTEEGRSTRKIPRQETERCAADKKGDGCDEVLLVSGGGECNEQRSNHAKASADAVHVVHEVEGVGHGENPQHGDRVAEDRIGHKECDANASG